MFAVNDNPVEDAAGLGVPENKAQRAGARRPPPSLDPHTGPGPLGRCPDAVRLRGLLPVLRGARGAEVGGEVSSGSCPCPLGVPSGAASPPAGRARIAGPRRDRDRARDGHGQQEPLWDGHWGRARRCRSCSACSCCGTPGAVLLRPQGTGALPVTVYGRTAAAFPRADAGSRLGHGEHRVPTLAPPKSRRSWCPCPADTACSPAGVQSPRSVTPETTAPLRGQQRPSPPSPCPHTLRGFTGRTLVEGAGLEHRGREPRPRARLRSGCFSNSCRDTLRLGGILKSDSPANGPFES
ncbi:uncharacterized protein LOC134551877 [Prinia subflava]|uniref:uncharacterized protein LOC134551877 n=1 Tax=Prinia subflava TaxID=208062 RepID=UPI002FE05D56